MIEVLPDHKENVRGIKATGKLTGSDYQMVLIPLLENVIQQYGKARLLFQMDDDFKGWELGAMWDDAKFGLAHRNDFQKVAVVGGPDWVEWGTKIGSLFMSGEVKTFSSAQLEEAWNWVKT